MTATTPKQPAATKASTAKAPAKAPAKPLATTKVTVKRSKATTRSTAKATAATKPPTPEQIVREMLNARDLAAWAGPDWKDAKTKLVRSHYGHGTGRSWYCVKGFGFEWSSVDDKDHAIKVPWKDVRAMILKMQPYRIQQAADIAKIADAHARTYPVFRASKAAQGCGPFTTPKTEAQKAMDRERKEYDALLDAWRDEQKHLESLVESAWDACWDAPALYTIPVEPAVEAEPEPVSA